jgi:hypothetical protein
MSREQPSRSRDSTAPVTVDCEKCHHFSGRHGLVRVEWGCQKGQVSESTVTLMRYNGCSTYREASRDELIFRRFKSSASFHGSADLKSRQTQARRAANGLSKALAEFGDLMDGAQVKAGREAVAALNRLADDIARASTLAGEFKKREDAQREAQRRKQGDALADRLLPEWTELQLVGCAEHLAAFEKVQARQWLQIRHGRSMLVESSIWAVNDLAQRWKQAAVGLAKTELFAELRRDVAQALEGLDRPMSRDYATRVDFEAYRQLLRNQTAAKAAVAEVVSKAMKPTPLQPDT